MAVQKHDGPTGISPGMAAVQRDIAADGDVELVKALEHGAQSAGDSAPMRWMVL